MTVAPASIATAWSSSITEKLVRGEISSCRRLLVARSHDETPEQERDRRSVGVGRAVKTEHIGKAMGKKCEIVVRYCYCLGNHGHARR